MNQLSKFSEIWIVDFEFKISEGGLPDVHCMVAREVHSQDLIRLSGSELKGRKAPPFDVGPGSLFVAYYSSAEFGCFVSLGWALPANTLDLYVEYRRLLAGLEVEQRFPLLRALAHFNLSHLAPIEKEDWRHLALRGGPFTKAESAGLLDYCQEDVDATFHLLRAMADSLQFPYCLFRGRYMQSVALMERQGIPIDMDTLTLIKDNWEFGRKQLIQRIDKLGVYTGSSFSEKRFEAYLAEESIPWPRLDSGRLALDEDTFRQQSKKYPGSIAKYHELRIALSKLKLNKLAIGSDGRNRTLLSPFRSTTSRNQPSTSKFIFGPSTWIRGLIKPIGGSFLAYIDWSQQELGIAAALSGDNNMKDAYHSGDPYLRFAQMANAVPETATKRSHPTERAAYKVCMLAVQYGMGAKSLATQLGRPLYEADKLLRAHKDTFPRYWEWNQGVVDTGFLEGRLTTTFGWTRLVTSESKPASVGNFPVQANGAEMLRIAIGLMQNQGLRVCAPIHDAVLIEGPKRDELECLDILRNACVRLLKLFWAGLPSMKTQKSSELRLDTWMRNGG